MAFSQNGVVIPNHDEYLDIEGEDDDKLEEEDNYFVQPNTNHYETKQSMSTFAAATIPTIVILALPTLPQLQPSLTAPLNQNGSK